MSCLGEISPLYFSKNSEKEKIKRGKCEKRSLKIIQEMRRREHSEYD
jgi:hypothetical protein